MDIARVGEPREQFETSPAAPASDEGRYVLRPERIAAAMRHPALVVFLSLVALLQIYRVALRLPGRIHEEDFADYYAAAMIMRAGENPYRSSLRSVGSKLGLHTKVFQSDDIIPETPTFLLGLKALGALPLEQAYWTWMALNLAALAGAFFLLLGPGSGLGLAEICLMVSLAVMYPPLLDLVLTAQSQFLVLLALALAMRWLAAGRDARAGAVLAAAALFRGFPVLMGIYLLLARKWRAAVYMILSGVLGIPITAAFLGWSVAIDFPRSLSTIGADPALPKLAFNTAPASLVWRLCFYLSGWHLGPGSDLWAHILGFAASLIFLAFAVKAGLTRRPGRDGDLRLFTLWIATSIEVLPVSWLNYNVLLFVPFAAIVWAGRRNRASSRTMWAAMISYFLSLFAFGGLVFTGLGSLPAVVVVAECKSVAVIVGYLAAYWFTVDDDHTLVPERRR
jgi:Glycosyltransferase family 87